MGIVPIELQQHASFGLHHNTVSGADRRGPKACAQLRDQIIAPIDNHRPLLLKGWRCWDLLLFSGVGGKYGFLKYV